MENIIREIIFRLWLAAWEQACKDPIVATWLNFGYGNADRPMILSMEEYIFKKHGVSCGLYCFTESQELND